MKAAQALAGAAQGSAAHTGHSAGKTFFPGAGAKRHLRGRPAGETQAGTQPAEDTEGTAQSGPQLAVDEFDVPQGDIPEGMLPLIYKFYPQGSGNGISLRNATIRNATELPDSEVAAEVNGPCPFPSS